MIHDDSKNIKRLDDFVAIGNGSRFSLEVLDKQAKKIIKTTRQKISLFAKDYFHNPDEKITIIAITGTNGKTTITTLLNNILLAAGFNPVLIGTINSNLTTPESFKLFSMFDEAVKSGHTHFIMEASSIGVDQHRLDNIHFDFKLLTNITRDHLDYHKTMKEYTKAKFTFLKNMPGKSFYPKDYKQVKLNFSSNLLGRFNQDNLKATYLLAKELGIKEEIIENSLKNARAPKGRFENVDLGQDFKVIIDYAHTPDGLQNVLTTAKEIAIKQQGKLISVFGCGGDRDRTKRPIMGKISQDIASYSIVTSDNPRTENPNSIIQEILTGMSGQGAKEIIPDRKEAIFRAINLAKKNDVILIAGKGHENYQIIGNQTYHFDDREVSEEALNALLH